MIEGIIPCLVLFLNRQEAPMDLYERFAFISSKWKLKNEKKMSAEPLK